jgi:hypothetical protein
LPTRDIACKQSTPWRADPTSAGSMSTASAAFKSPPPPPLSIGSVGSRGAHEQSGSDTFDNAILPESNTALSDSSSYCSTVFVNIGGAVSPTSPVLTGLFHFSSQY